MSEGKPSLIGSKPTIWMRLIAGCWFAVTGFISALVSFLLISGPLHPIGSLVFVKGVIIPIPIFALCGAVIGTPIVYELRGSPEYAALRGAAVAVLSLTLYVFSLAIINTFESASPNLGSVVFSTLYFMIFWGVVRFVPVMVIGAVAGWLLYCTSNFRGHRSLKFKL